MGNVGLNALSLLEGRICCPDDGSVLVFEEERFRCPACVRYPMVEDRFLDLVRTMRADLPGSDLSASYLRIYYHEIKNISSKTWGQPEKNPQSWIAQRERQVKFALPLVLNGQSGESMILVDFSGGCGYHTIHYSQYFKLVVHCDLSSANLIYTWHKARKLGINNIVFVRMDYFRPPFVGGFERIISFDTLIYGSGHERRLLREIYSALSPNGIAVVDFHNWWHNPVRRLGLLRKNFPAKGSHSKHFITNLLAEVGISSYEYFPFYQEFANDHALAPLFSFFIQPTRLHYRIRKAA